MNIGKPGAVKPSGRTYRFSGFTLDSGDWTLHGPDGTPLHLTPKAFDALIFLLEHAGQVINRAALVERLWPDTIVEENNLRQVIAALRRALGDTLIRTVPRRGYQLVTDVHIVSDTAGKAAPRMRRVTGRAIALLTVVLATVTTVFFWQGTSETGSEQPAHPPLLTVLPFTDTSADGNLEYIADAIAQELLTNLSLIDGLRVSPSTSSFYFRDRAADLATIREILGTDYVLEGDVRSADERLRISVRLIDVESASQIWSETYDRVPDDLFELEDEIALMTTQALEITLGVGERGRRLGTTRNADAFFAFAEAGRILREGGRFSTRSVRTAIPHLERAVALDENFAIAWFELYWQSRWLSILASDTGESAPGAMERARHALQRVEALTPNLPELVISKIENSADAHELASAMQRLLDEAALSHYPPAILNEIEARYLRFTGRMREATAAAERGRAFDPLNPVFVGVLADGYAAEGRFDDALAVIDDFARLSGSGAEGGPAGFFIALESGNLEEIEKRVAVLHESPSPVIRSLARNVHAPEAGLAILRDFVAAPDPTMVLWPTALAPWAAWFGDDELALEMYRREVPFATGNTISRPIFSGMRNLPGFTRLVADVGLLSYWRESGNWPDYCRPLPTDNLECF